MDVHGIEVQVGVLREGSSEERHRIGLSEGGGRRGMFIGFGKINGIINQSIIVVVDTISGCMMSRVVVGSWWLLVGVGRGWRRLLVGRVIVGFHGGNHKNRYFVSSFVSTL